MKILMDAYTPPDIMLYDAIRRDLKDNHYIITITPNTPENIALLEKKKIKFTVIGLRSTRGMAKKILINILRILSGIRLIAGEKPDLCISRSPSMVIASYLSGVPVAMLIDNDAATLALISTFPFASLIFMPKVIKEMNRGLPEYVQRKTYFYEGIEEMIYLDSIILREDVYSILSLSRNKKIITFRPFAIQTEYEKGKEDKVMNLLLKICRDDPIKNKYHFIVLPRTEEQRKKYRDMFKDTIVVPTDSLDGPSLLLQTDIFIGAGGTMTREAWVLGTTAISMYSGRPLSVEKYLTEKGEGYFKTTDIDEVVKLIKTHHEKENDRSNPNLKNEIIERIAKITEVKR